MYPHHDGRFTYFACVQFSSLEPDVLCRLVYVKDVEISSQEQDTQPQTPPGITMLLVLCCSAAVLFLSGKSAFISMDAGQTELPTCPVCLERLDEHISGVVTTVSQSTVNECQDTYVFLCHITVVLLYCNSAQQVDITSSSNIRHAIYTMTMSVFACQNSFSSPSLPYLVISLVPCISRNPGPAFMGQP